MKDNGDRFFVQVPDCNGQGTLYPATLIDAHDGTYTAVSTEAVRTMEAGAECMVFFEHDKEFMKQPARIDAFLPTEAEHAEAECDDCGACPRVERQDSDTICTFGFQTLGEPVSAEQRQCYRVSTVMSDVTVHLADENHCKVLDVSATGFSLASAQRRDVGTVCDVNLLFEDEEFTGKACVQNSVELASGEFRHGLYGIRTASGNCELDKGFRTISMAIQRQQLRRMTGTD